jgi:hypothetical protein
MDSEEIIIFLSALSVVAGLLASCVKYCSRSHCTNISLCNHFIDIKKDDDVESHHHKRESIESDDTERENIPQIDLKTVQNMI